MAHQDPAQDQAFDAALVRWRPEVLRRLPTLDAGVAEEVAQHVAERWVRVVSAESDVHLADAAAHAEIDRWLDVRVPTLPRRRVHLSLALTSRQALRSLRHRPVFAACALLLLSIGIGVAVAVFVVANGVLVRPLPYPAGTRLAVVWQSVRGAEGQVSYPDYEAFRASSSFDASGALLSGRGTLMAGDAVDRINTVEVESSVLAMLGARVVAGRLLNASDVGRPVALISHRLWQSHFLGDPAAVGRMVSLSGHEYSIVGVLAPGFDVELPVASAFVIEHNDVWTPLDTNDPITLRREVSTYQVIVRLGPGVSLTQAQASLDTIGRVLAKNFHATNQERLFRVVSLHDQMVARARRPLMLLMAAAVLVLLVALANLVTLVSVRISAARGEFAIRGALGADPGRLRFERLVECLMLTGAGMIGGLVVARTLVGALTGADAHLPRPEAIQFDAEAVAVAGGLALVIAVGLMCLSGGNGHRGMSPLGATDRVLNRRFGRSRRVVAAGQIAMALTMSTAAALFALSLARLTRVDPGFVAEGVLTARVSAYASRYPTQLATAQFFDRIIDDLRALPDVAVAAAGSSLPLSGQSTSTEIAREGAPLAASSRVEAGWQTVTPNYFAATGIAVRAGRDFDARDRAAAQHVTIINESLARRVFGSEDPIGRRIGVGGASSNDWHEIIGVVGDVRHSALDRDPEPRAYDLLGQHWGRTMFLVVRTRTRDASGNGAAMRRVVHAADPQAPVFDMTTLDQLVSRSVATRRLVTLLALSLGLMALLLALIGVYAVIACSVAERVREMGLRIALGSTTTGIVRLVLAEGFLIALAGCIAGGALAAIAASALRSSLFEIQVADTWRLVSVMSVALMSIGTATALGPALRAARVDPLTAIRDSSH